MKSLKLFTVLLAAIILAPPPALAEYPANFLEGQVGMEEMARATGCFDSQGNLYDWAVKKAPDYAREPRTWANHATCVLVDHSVHWQFPGGERGEGDSEVAPVIPPKPVVAPYVSLDTEDYVCPEKLPTDKARMDEMMKWTLWAYALGYKTAEQLGTFRKGFLEGHHCYITLQNLERNAESFLPPPPPRETKIVDPALAIPGDIIKEEFESNGPNGIVYVSWTIKSDCPAQWIPIGHGKRIWFTGTFQKDGEKGSTYSDATPNYLFFNPSTGLMVSGIPRVDTDTLMHKVCPGNNADLE